MKERGAAPDFLTHLMLRHPLVLTLVRLRSYPGGGGVRVRNFSAFQETSMEAVVVATPEIIVRTSMALLKFMEVVPWNFH